MYKAIFFDLDDTLIDFSSCQKLAIDLLYKECQKELSIEKALFRKYFLQINRKLWDEVESSTLSVSDLRFERFNLLVDRLSLSKSPNKLASIFEGYIAENIRFYPGVWDALLFLKKHHQLGIVTNGLTSLQLKKMQTLGLLNLFDDFVIAESVGFAKPDSRIFTYLLQKMGIKNSECLMVGDSVSSDYLGSLRIGMDFCLIGSSVIDTLRFPEPKFAVQSVSELPALIFNR